MRYPGVQGLSDGYSEGQLHARDAMWSARVAAARQAATRAPAEPVRVYLVATGLTHEGRELYERHDVRPPLCDAETLYAAPPATPAAPAEQADTLILETSLRLTYSLLNHVVELDGAGIPKHVRNEIRKMLPARFPMSFQRAAPPATPAAPKDEA